jgi:hypothetical protein
MTDAVEKGFCEDLRATLLQDQDQMRNLDFRKSIARIRSFHFLIPQLFCGDFFDSIGQTRTYCNFRSRSALAPRPDIGESDGHVRVVPIPDILPFGAADRCAAERGRADGATFR